MNFFKIFNKSGLEYGQRYKNNGDGEDLEKYCSVSLGKHSTSFILTLLNRSFKRFTLKNRFLMRAKAQHSMRTCLMVQGV